ncbi:alpha-xenorhabdolysin family binary toxin subunit B [Pseudomonas sp. SIMBA_065]|jgi:hypothetical protein
MKIIMDDLPDVEVMLQVETRMKGLYYSESTAMLPAVRERLLDLITLVGAGNDALRKKAVVSLVALNLALDDALPQQDEQELLRIRQDLRAEVSDIVEAIGRVGGYRSPSVIELKQAHEAVVVKQRDGIAEVEKMLADKLSKLEEVDALFETLDRPSVRKALRNTVPEERDIDRVLKTIKDPTVSPELVKAALSNLNKHLDLLEQGRRFADVVTARKKLSDAQVEQKRTLDHLRQQLKKAEHEAGQFASVEELLENRTPWLEQAGKFTDAWQVHCDALSASTTPEALGAALGQARDYLLALRRRFEAV